MKVSGAVKGWSADDSVRQTQPVDKNPDWQCETCSESVTLENLI